MVHSVPATQAKNRFGEMLKHVYAHRDHIIVEKSGIAVAAIIPISLYSSIYAKRKNADPNVSERMDIAEETVACKLDVPKVSRQISDERKVVIDNA